MRTVGWFGGVCGEAGPKGLKCERAKDHPEKLHLAHGADGLPVLWPSSQPTAPEPKKRTKRAVKSKETDPALIASIVEQVIKKLKG